MKKITILTTIFFAFLICNAQTSDNANWDYPLKPGSAEWQNFKSVDEMYRACQIPDHVLNRLDTESLVDLCLGFPTPPLFILFNTPQQAFMEYYTNFNGIRELFRRKDAGVFLLNRYASMTIAGFNPLWPLHQQGQFISTYKFIESILSQPQVIASLDAGGRKELLRETIRKMEEKLSMQDLFSGFSLEINLWVTGKVLFSEDPSLMQEHNRQNIQEAMDTGIFIDLDLDRLYRQAKNRAYESE